MQSTRTFIAIGLPKPKIEKLTHLQSLLAPQIPNVRWAEGVTLHLTLTFLGEVENADLNNVCKTVQRVVTASSAFDLRLEKFGAFPDQTRARTLWVGIGGGGLDTLLALQADINQAVGDAGYPTGENSFHPHITIGRMQKGRQFACDVTPQIQHFQTWTAGHFNVTEVTTYSSHLTREGPVYTPLSTASLPRRKNRQVP